MADEQTIFGQSDALAREIVTELNGATAGTFCLALTAVHRYVRVTELAKIPGLAGPVAVDVFAGILDGKRKDMHVNFDDIYGIHVIVQQSVVDPVAGGLSETQVGLLLQLQTEIIEYLSANPMDVPAAVHPYTYARVFEFRTEGGVPYDHVRLSNGDNLFSSEIVLTYGVRGINRKT